MGTLSSLGTVQDSTRYREVTVGQTDCVPKPTVGW